MLRDKVEEKRDGVGFRVFHLTPALMCCLEIDRQQGFLIGELETGKQKMKKSASF